MAATIATATARLLERLPQLVVSVEGNLIPADAYFSGQATRFEDSGAFRAHFKRAILGLAAGDESLQRFADNVRRADPSTLWTLGRSVAAHSAPGEEFRRLQCPTLYYWDPAGASEASRRFIAEYELRERKFPGWGHWPMIRSPERFYTALDEDIWLEAGNRTSPRSQVQ